MHRGLILVLLIVASAPARAQQRAPDGITVDDQGHPQYSTFSICAIDHDSVMSRGAQHLTVSVVPDSGTGELTGLSGTMTILDENGKHSYEFDYTFGGTR